MPEQPPTNRLETALCGLRRHTVGPQTRAQSGHTRCAFDGTCFTTRRVSLGGIARHLMIRGEYAVTLRGTPPGDGGASPLSQLRGSFRTPAGSEAEMEDRVYAERSVCDRPSRRRAQFNDKVASSVDSAQRRGLPEAHPATLRALKRLKSLPPDS